MAKLTPQTLRDEGFRSRLANPDVWIKAKPNGDKHWRHVLFYFDDAITQRLRVKTNSQES
jgi:hypothetical protein